MLEGGGKVACRLWRLNLTRDTLGACAQICWSDWVIDHVHAYFQARGICGRRAITYSPKTGAVLMTKGAIPHYHSISIGLDASLEEMAKKNAGMRKGKGLMQIAGREKNGV